MSAHLHIALDRLKEEFEREGALGPESTKQVFALLVEILCELDDIARRVQEMAAPSIVPCGRLQ